MLFDKTFITERGENMIQYFMVALGGGIGAIFRYLLTKIQLPFETTFPIITLFINFAGAFLIGIIVSTTAKYALSEKTVLFLGDSLINENIYTNCVKELFENDAMNIHLIGTRGTEENKHEGRGGWSAYDYCNEQTKYGFTNPFLNNGKFDFGYYMKSNEYAGVDYVVISLGVNDLNIVGHNSHSEIIGYFNTIFDSIHQYDADIKIILNTPTMLFSTESTDGAKNTRLEFTKTLKQTYENKEYDGIYLSAISMSINPSMNFKWIEQTDKSKPMKVSDTTHPNLHGYQNMAKTTYAFIKYLAELEK